MANQRNSVQMGGVASSRAWLLLSILTCVGGVFGIQPKFMCKPVTPGEELGHAHKVPFNNLSSNFAAFFGYCAENEHFEFTISAGSGRGGVVMTSTDSNIEVVVAEGFGTSTIELLQEEIQETMFGFETGTKPSQTVAFGFDGIGDDGATARVTCSTKTREQVFVAFRDDSGLVVDATNSFGTASEGQKIKLESGVKSNQVLRGEDKQAEVDFVDATDDAITLRPKQAGKKSTALVQLSIRDEQSGKLVQRTLVTEVREKATPPKKLNLKMSDVDDNGDVTLTFMNVGNPNQVLKFEARVGLIRLGKAEATSNTIDIVDVSAILPSHKATLIVHGGWIHRVLEEQDLLGDENDGKWDIVIKEAFASDPENSYELVGHLEHAVETGLGKNQSQKAHRKKTLAVRPTDEEHVISKEMRHGRKPQAVAQPDRNRVRGRKDDAKEGSLRRLSGNHKIILVHGYCAGGNPFPLNQFGNEIAFSDPDTSNPQPSSWSHDTFARKIDKFADNAGLHGCACIAHSQGGAACLHLYSYYWSCLDDSEYGGSRMIQSVGTPYLGTSLAGNIALLGDIFGVGCGANYDLTYSGASNWYNAIPIWAESEVHYYTTSFEDKWWRYDYCNIASDVILSDPDDGTTEKAAGQLVYGNNRGHTQGWCHTTGMRDPAQYLDSNRNSDMNNNAKY